jgi:hypothetical protein
MKAPITLCLLLLAVLASADPAQNIGRVLPHLELVTGDIHKNAEIVAADADGITIATETGKHVLSRYALPPAARVALGYAEEPDKRPVHGYFRIVQIGRNGYVVRRHRPAPASGSFAKLMNEISNRTSIADQEGQDDPKLYFLSATVDPKLADDDLISGQYVPLDQTKTLTDAITGTPRVLRAMVLLKGERYLPNR